MSGKIEWTSGFNQLFPLAGNQLQKTITALERWETVTPCSSDTTKSLAHLMLYTDGELGESEGTLKTTINGLASVNKCFKEVSYASAALTVSFVTSLRLWLL